jgi:hypothetical protein
METYPGFFPTEENIMYMGHFAMAFAAKPVASKISLGVLLVAPQVIDILYGFFALIGVSQIDYNPWDHSLVMSLVWSVAAIIIYFVISHDLLSGIIIGLLVSSHWVCDFISWDHVLPLTFGNSQKVGLGLYNSMPTMLAVDFGLFGIAFAYYLFRTKPRDHTGKWAPWALVAYLLALIPTTLLPGKLIIITAIGMLLVVPIGMWIDRHRSIIPVQKKKESVVKT